MRVTAWRIVQAGHADEAFSGEGARLYGGRWNRRGTRMVYTAGSISLAALEMLVHLDAYQLLSAYVCIPVEFDDSMCLRIGPSDVPVDWTSDPAPASTQDIGTDWARDAASVVLAVPSVLVPPETNFLINPLYPDFGKLTIGVPQPFQYDPRLIKME